MRLYSIATISHERALICLKLTLFPWSNFQSSAYVLFSNSLACVRAGEAWQQLAQYSCHARPFETRTHVPAGLIIQNPYGYLKKDQSRKKSHKVQWSLDLRYQLAIHLRLFFAPVPQTYCAKFFLIPILFDLRKIVKLECLKTRCTCTKNQ